jgi:hypothetical protein
MFENANDEGQIAVNIFDIVFVAEYEGGNSAIHLRHNYGTAGVRLLVKGKVTDTLSRIKESTSHISSTPHFPL